ncbi:hypothetical protein CN354_14485 [Bacillus cereus]|nr:hypothetical protein CN354_14485 [Bacillus cereus]
MLGENKANDSQILKYSLIKDFFDSFQLIKLEGIPLPQCLIGLYIKYITPVVNSNLNNETLINNYKTKYRFVTMKDIQQSLINYEIQEVPLEKNQKNILMSNEYLHFSCDQLKEYGVYLYGINNPFSNLPSHIHYVPLTRRLVQFRRSSRKEQLMLQEQAQQILMRNKQHFLFGSLQFQQWLIKSLAHIIRWVKTLDDIVQTIKPAVIVDPVEISIFGTILGLLAKKYKIPFINMPVLLINDRSLLPTRADHYIVWGDRQKDWLIERGILADKITLAGNVGYWYEQQKKEQVSKDQLYKKLNIPKTMKLFVFTTQPFGNPNKIISNWLSNLPENNCMVIIKKHRNDTTSYELLQNKKNILICPEDIGLYDLLHNAEALLTISSNTAIQAALLNIPLIILQPRIPYDFELNYDNSNVHLVRENAGAAIYNPVDLITALNNIVLEGSFRSELVDRGKEYLGKVLHSTDQAHILAKNQIVKLMNNK